MNQPWYFIGFGALLSAFSGFLVWRGLERDVDELVLAGWGIGSLSGLALFVGLIALAVEIGVRGADR